MAFFALLYASLALCEIVDPQLLNVLLNESKNPPFIFLRVFGIYNIIKDIIVNVRKTKRHNITVPISLEDIHNKRQKKLRLILKGCPEPVFLTVQVTYKKLQDGEIIEYGNHIINLNYKIIEHKQFSFDENVATFLDQLDLYTKVTITLMDYLCGSTKILRYLDDTDLIIEIPAFVDMDIPLIKKNKGLCGVGDLIIEVGIILPKGDKWTNIKIKEQEEYLKKINALY